jgi:hypothetical protein
MLIRTLTASAAVLLLAVPAGAFAADAHGNFAVRGVGSESCKALSDSLARKDPNAGLTLESWVGGYVTALDRLQGDTFDASPIMSNGALAQMVANVCQRAPTTEVETVTFDIFRAMGPSRVRNVSTNVEAKVGTANVVLRKETLIAIQTELQRQGLSKEAPTGLFTPATEAALKSFQAAHKLPQTGVPDPGTTIAVLAPGK